MTLTVRAGVSGDLALSPDIGAAAYHIAESFALAFAPGTANGEVDKAYVDTFSISASGNIAYDLAGALTDAFGLAFTPAEIAAILVYADPTNVNNVVVGGDTNGVPVFSDKTDSIPVRPGCFFLITMSGAGVTVTASTGDILKLTNSSSGSAVTGKLIILGRSA